MSQQIFHAKREDYAINTKEVLSAALDGVMLLGNVSHSLNNLRKEKLRPTLSRDLQHLCDSSNSVTSYLLGMTFQRELKKLKKLPESHFPRNHKDHTIIVVPTTKMDILVTNQVTCRSEAQKSKPAATAPRLPKLHLTMVGNTPKQCDKFQVGRLKNYIKAWETITDNPEIIETISGVKLDFLDNPPSCSTISNIGFSKIEETAIDNEIENLLAKQVIIKCVHESGEYISPIFVQPKHDDTYRLILNLKNLNNDMPYVHFKMVNFSSVLNLITPGCYLASIDQEDAYYSVHIHTDYTKYLKFFWKG